MKKLITIFIILFLSVIVKAQTEKTNERLITQLKNGTVPGWKYAPNTQAATVVNKTVEQIKSLVAQNRKGIALGTLASEKPVQKETLKTIAALPPVPTQEAVKQENKQ